MRHSVGIGTPAPSAASIPAKRVAKPEEIAETVLYLMANSYTTGSTLYVDGGVTLR